MQSGPRAAQAVEKHLTDSSLRLADYVAIARPDHWFKNVFMLPGAALAIALGGEFTTADAINLAVAIVSTCLIASANYTINEWLDAEFDRHHPLKKQRPSAVGRVKPYLVYTQWTLLALIGLLLAATITTNFLVVAAMLLVMGLVYNVRPFRTKDRQYLDVISESVNNPLRFMLGWCAITPVVLPPSSILLAYWAGGAFLMGVKRYAEYRYIGDPERAGSYRRSFKFYTEESLLLSSFFYALFSAFFLGVFLIKYRIEFLLSLPFFAILFVWYLKIGMRTDSVTQRPEKLYKEVPFLVYVACLSVLVTMLFFIDLPWLESLVTYYALPTGS